MLFVNKPIAKILYIFQTYFTRSRQPRGDVYHLRVGGDFGVEVVVGDQCPEVVNHRLHTFRSHKNVGNQRR